MRGTSENTTQADLRTTASAKESAASTLVSSYLTATSLRLAFEDKTLVISSKESTDDPLVNDQIKVSGQLKEVEGETLQNANSTGRKVTLHFSNGKEIFVSCPSGLRLKNS